MYSVAHAKLDFVLSWRSYLFLDNTTVIETFQLKISEEHLMSRCTKCNACFIRKPLNRGGC